MNTIPFEYANSVKNLVGKTLTTKDGRNLIVTKWVGTNLIISDPATGKEGTYPAMTIIDQITRKNLTVK